MNPHPTQPTAETCYRVLNFAHPCILMSDVIFTRKCKKIVKIKYGYEREQTNPVSFQNGQYNINVSLYIWNKISLFIHIEQCRKQKWLAIDTRSFAVMCTKARLINCKYTQTFFIRIIQITLKISNKFMVCYFAIIFNHKILDSFQWKPRSCHFSKVKVKML